MAFPANAFRAYCRVFDVIYADAYNDVVLISMAVRQFFSTDYCSALSLRFFWTERSVRNTDHGVLQIIHLTFNTRYAL